MSEFGDKSAATVKESASRSALEASTKLSELFMEVASKKGDEQSFREEMDEKLKDVLPSLSIVSFQNDNFLKYDTDGDGAVNDAEMDAAIKSDKTSQKDKLMLTHLAKQYEVLKNQNQQDGRDGENANGITNKDVETYLSNNPKDQPLLSANGSTTRNFGTWQETTQPDGTIVKTKDGKVFQYVPQGDWSRISNIENRDKGEITINGQPMKVNPSDQISMSENGTVFVVREGRYTDEYRPDGTVIKKDGANIIEVKIPGQIEARWNGTQWVDKDGKPTNIKHVEVDAGGNVKVIHKDDSYNIYHPDGSYEIYDAKGNKKCDVDAATAKATSDKKSELQDLSKIESGKGPYDAAKKMLEAAGVSPLTHKVILEFARWLRDKIAQKTSFKSGEQLVTDDNWQRVRDKINEIKASQKK